MIFSSIKLQNWRNFAKVNVELADRVFIVGPNAASLEEIKILLNKGMNPAEAILPITKPKEVEHFFLGF